MYGPYRVALVSQLLERLPHEPWSMYRAAGLGGPKWFGYSHDSERLSDVLDRLTLMIKATAVNKATLRDSDMVERPSSGSGAMVVSSKDAESVAALFAALG